MKSERIITWVLATIVFGSGAVFGQVSRWAMETASVLSAKSIPVSVGAGLFASDTANFAYDTASHRLGLGTTNPLAQIHMTGQTSPQMIVEGIGDNALLKMQPGPGFHYVGVSSTTVDGDDTTILRLTGGGDFGTDRGGMLELHGNESTGAATLRSGGVGPVRLLPGDGDIQWGKPLVALGSGPTATLGETGGDGPTSSSQVGWMRGLDDTGQAIWIPVYK